MTPHEFFSDPGSVRSALLGLAGAAALGALIVRRIKQKLHPEPRVIRLTLDQQPVSPRDDEDSTRHEGYQATGASKEMGTTPSLTIPESSAIPNAATVSQSIAFAESPAVEGYSSQAQPSDVSPVHQSAEAAAEAPPAEAIPEYAALESQPTPVSDSAYPLLALQERSPVMLDIMRGAIIICAIFVFAALVLVVLPQGGVDKIAAALRPRNAPGPPPEKVAFLYLGDEIKDNQFHIRGVIRNISSQPLEQLQATVRLYAVDRTLLETQIVRMDSEIVFPNNTASFHLSFSDYHGQFGSYSLDFKLAQGDPVLYKDMRDARAGS